MAEHALKSRSGSMLKRQLSFSDNGSQDLRGDAADYGTHSMRRTKAAQIYRKTGNLRAVQLLLGHTKLESTVRYLGVEVDDALSIAEQVEL
jgi:site-specific recombinase XerC